MMSDDFIESIMTPQSKKGDATMVYREFRGMESVAQYGAENECGKPVSAFEKEGDEQ